jgi:hypothetical protein
MMDSEVDALVKRVCVLWNRPFSPDMAAAWKPFLVDLDTNSVRDAVDAIMVRGDRFLPTVGEVRRIALEPSNQPPAPLEAWAQFQTRLRAATSGLAIPPVHDLVLETMKRIGGGAGMHTNGDRDAFVAAYAAVVGEWEAERFKVNRAG